MTTAQVREYVSIAARARCRAMYSLNRERSPFNAELTSVSEVLAEQYDLRDVPVLETEYTTAMKKPLKAGREGERPALSYRHLAGTLRSVDTRGLAVSNAAPILERAVESTPGIVLGMTLHNNARHLREAANSILSQTRGDFALVMLDDGSSDETEQIAREIERHDPRVRYVRQPVREGMVPTWRHVVEIAARDYPRARYFAWVSDHDRWHPDWLARMAAALDADPEVVLAYAETRRIDAHGRLGAKEPRAFQTAGIDSMVDRWRAFCRGGVGSGDMVYGLMRLEALQRAGIFRSVLNPDRLLLAELTLQGQIRQVDAPLWFRREAAVASTTRQRTTLFAGAPPRIFALPPALQHAVVIAREYIAGLAPPVRVPTLRLLRMLAFYLVTTAWRDYRKTEASKSVGRGVDHVYQGWKIVKKGARHAVYHALVGLHVLRGKSRRIGRRVVYEVLMFTHRAGLRGPRNGTHIP
jgi:glycosyltransferase involved in cell wall biosynthesis